MYPFKEFSNNEIQNIKNFSYKTEDTPFLTTPAVQKFFNFIHLYIPNAISPNQITWIGGASMLISLIITICFDSTLKSGNRKLHLANFAFLFLYFSADFMDGMHARRTNQCSSLGSLLDHGIDSLVCTVIIITAASSLQLGMSRTILFIAYNMYLGFYMAGMYLKYVGLFKHNLITGESRALLLLMLVHLIASFSPNTINAFKLLASSKGATLIFANASFLVISIGHTIINIIDLIYNITFIRNGFLSFSLLISFFNLTILIVFLITLFLNLSFKEPLTFYLSLISFSLSFTLCYIEETLSIMTTLNQSIATYLFSYFFIGLIIAAIFMKASKLTFGLLFSLSLIHFLLRIGSILRGLSVALNVKLLF